MRRHLFENPGGMWEIGHAHRVLLPKPLETHFETLTRKCK